MGRNLKAQENENVGIKIIIMCNPYSWTLSITLRDLAVTPTNAFKTNINLLL